MAGRFAFFFNKQKGTDYIRDLSESDREAGNDEDPKLQSNYLTRTIYVVGIVALELL
jgi:hypothetical protein